jgi:hypothetical protein
MQIHPLHTNPDEQPPTRGVDAVDPRRGAHGSTAPLNSTLRDALTDLATHNGTSSARPNQQLCPVCTCLSRHGLATWTTNGRWAITPAGYAYLETRTTHPEETR